MKYWYVLISMLCGNCVGTAFTTWWQHNREITYHKGGVAPVHVMKAYGWVEVHSHPFLIFEVQGVMIQI